MPANHSLYSPPPRTPLLLLAHSLRHDHCSCKISKRTNSWLLLRLCFEEKSLSLNPRRLKLWLLEIESELFFLNNSTSLGANFNCAFWASPDAWIAFVESFAKLLCFTAAAPFGISSVVGLSARSMCTAAIGQYSNFVAVNAKKWDASTENGSATLLQWSSGTAHFQDLHVHFFQSSTPQQFWPKLERRAVAIRKYIKKDIIYSKQPCLLMFSTAYPLIPSNRSLTSQPTVFTLHLIK